MSTTSAGARPRARITLLRDVLAWALPIASCVGCTTFFVALSMRASWLAQPVFSPSLSRATVVGVGLLLWTVAGILLFSYVAERADRAAASGGRSP